MNANELAISTMKRKLAYLAFGWFATKWYNSSFGLYWEYPHAKPSDTQSDWAKILSKYGNKSRDIFISAGDLWSMGPFLISVYEDPKLVKAIRKIYVRHVSREIVDYLSNGNQDFLPLISPKLLDRLDSNVNELRNRYGVDNVIVKPWAKFPKFHGVIYGSHLSYCPWGLDPQGMLSHRTAVRFMHREHDIELFDEYKRAFVDGLIL